MTKERREEIRKEANWHAPRYGRIARTQILELLEELERKDAEIHAVSESKTTILRVIQDDIAAILDSLNLGSFARSESCHKIVYGEILPAIRRKDAVVEAARKAADMAREHLVESWEYPETTKYTLGEVVGNNIEAILRDALKRLDEEKR